MQMSSGGNLIDIRMVMMAAKEARADMEMILAEP